MRRIPYLDNTAPGTSPEQRDTAFLSEALNSRFIYFRRGEVNEYARASSPLSLCRRLVAHLHFPWTNGKPSLASAASANSSAELPRRSLKCSAVLSYEFSSFYFSYHFLVLMINHPRTSGYSYTLPGPLVCVHTAQEPRLTA
jgi:hypothetical protein